MATDDIEDIIYAAVMAFLSSSLIILGILLFILCRKKPPIADQEQPQNTLPIKICAQPYQLNDIEAATENFNPSRMIGQGRLGSVYCAALLLKDSNHQEMVAVKRIHPRLVMGNGGFGFSSVIKSISQARHPNILPIKGFAQAPGERIIISDLISLGNLEMCLHSNNNHHLLNWSRRVKIAAGAARGLEYLHQATAPSIVHGCVKASNILIDHTFCARVCDYGMSLLCPTQEKSGVLGFVDDEYWMGGGVCKESDVYGFRVVLLEILSGRRSEEGLLVKWGMSVIKEMRMGELLDPRLVIPCDLKPLVRMARVALACVGNSRENRPSMAQVAAILSNLDTEVSISCP